MDIQNIIRLQALTGRTSGGRYIGEEQVRICKEVAHRTDFNDREFEECINCKFVCYEEYFTTGCPNCGCKDTNRL